MKLPETLYLDLKKWRCGGDSRSKKKRMGHGETYLLNNEGYSCCLGQWIQQTDKSLNIKGFSSPKCVFNCKIHTLVNPSIFNFDTKFAGECMDINDDEDTTILEKIASLRKILKKYKRKLVVRRK